MKSGTLYCNKTVFRKNLTRFAPAWGLYTVLLGMTLINITVDNLDGYMAKTMNEWAQGMCVITPCYALLCAQLLFGDLYNARMCNALHAMPLKRETWFATHVISGFGFHLISTAAIAIPATLILSIGGVEDAWQMGPLWLALVNLQFFCFFGMAVFSALCAGSRFAQAVVYGILNFAVAMAGWLVDTIYTPMYYGVRTRMEPFLLFSPVAHMTENAPVDLKNIRSEGYIDKITGVEIQLTGTFWYYLICATVGIGLIIGALALYRRRKLECAGDFMAVKGTEPVFLVVYSLVMGAVWHFVAEGMLGTGGMLFLFVGIAVGWYTGKMLLEGTVQVFRKKSLMHCIGLMAAVGLSLLVAWLDPFGIETWLPDGAAVESVAVTDSHYGYPNCQISLEEPEEIARVIQIHQGLMEGKAETRNRETVAESYAARDEMETGSFYSSVSLTYRLKDGREVSRYYAFWMDSQYGTYFRQLFNRPECVFGGETDPVQFLQTHAYVTAHAYLYDEELVFSADADLTELYRAMEADCLEGNMAQSWDYHNGADSIGWMTFSGGLELQIFTDSENTIRWLRENGMQVDERLEWMGK